MKICMAQLNFIVGDLEYNYSKISKTIKENRKCDLIIFSELALTGYPPLDLIERKGFVDDQLKYLQKVQKLTGQYKCSVILGCIQNNHHSGKKFHNSLAVIENGSIHKVYHKLLLPTYNIFDEDRYFEPGKHPGYWKFNDKKVGFLICEDAWYHGSDNSARYEADPIKELQRENVDFIISINASPSELEKQEQRRYLMNVSRCEVPLIYVNQVGVNDDIVFDGNSFVLNNKNKVIKQAKAFEEDVIVFDSNELFKRGYKKYVYQTDEQVMYKHIICGIRDYINKCGFKKVVVGSSGGIDSAVVIAMAVDAIGKENVEAITMPSRFSSTGSIDHSKILCDNLNVKLNEFPIKTAHETFLYAFNSSCYSNGFKNKPEGVTEENIQARIRGMVLMAFSNRYGHLVLSTGNKSEMAVGYCTQYGDMCGGLAPISDLYKMEVYTLARYYNKIHKKQLIPKVIIDKEPSAELSEKQKDSDSLPPYPYLDSILKAYIEEETYMIRRIKKGVIQKVLKMVDRAEFKRRQAPPTIRIHKKAWGAGRKLPIAQGYKKYEL